MQSFKNLKENIFSECQNYLQEIKKIQTQEDLFQHQKTIVKLFEQSQFLKKLSEIYFETPKVSEENILEIQQLEATNENLKKEYWEILQRQDLQISHLSAKIKALECKEIETKIILEKTPLEKDVANVPLKEENTKIKENNEIEDLKTEISEKSEENQTVEQQIKLIQEIETEERRFKIAAFNKVENAQNKLLPNFDHFKDESVSEKKFRLEKIKGLGIVKSLFDDDFLEEVPLMKTEYKSLHNSNMVTDFIEAEGHKQDFRIDLNDKMVFTKLLFNGDENELKSTINQLNSYKTVDEAKEYLSELYYTKDWKNVDDYAQRLWVLVENKFI